MKKKKLSIIISVAVAVALVAAAITTYCLLKTPSPTQVFKKSMNNVVEIKAQNDEDFVGYGTAELISKAGEFVTNAHVVTYSSMGVATKFESYFVRFAFENDYREVELVRYDIDLDLAILKLKALPDFKLNPIKIGDSAALKSGDRVYAIGNSQNFGISISQGIVGIPLINIEYDSRTRSVIQCDLTITEGNSGGALVDSKGRLVGITTFRTKDNKGNVIYGIAYSIPINAILQFVNT